MLIGHEIPPFDDDDYLFELKMDGIRCLAYINKNDVVLKNKRNKNISSIYPELQTLKNNIQKKCILDGEIIILKNGKPDFFSVQKRSLMTNDFQIKLSAKQNPVIFVAFDILFLDKKELLATPLIKRKELLNLNVIESKNLVISRFIYKYGVDFFKLAKKNKLEGVVGKKINSLYEEGKRTKNWVKIKVMIDEDLIICGFHLDEKKQIKDLILGYYDKNNKLKCRGKISLGISQNDKKIIINFALKNKVKTPWFDKYPQAIWIKLKLVGIAHYMQKTTSGSMRQAVFYGLRFDKEASECKK